MKIIPLFKVRNMKEAISFYTGVLDFELKYPEAYSEDGADLVKENIELQLTTHEGDYLFGSVVNIWVDEVDNLFKKYLERGLDNSHKKQSPVHQGPTDQTWGNREFYITDKDGNTLRFCKPIEMQDSNTQTSAEDKLGINSLTKTFFDIFNNIGQKKPDWSSINIICIPETIIIKKTGLTEVIYNLHQFIEPRRQILTDGTLIDFQENEIEEETRIIGNIAQRFSKYQKSGYLNGAYFKEYGNKFFQFIKTDNGWKINSLIWEDDKI